MAKGELLVFLEVEILFVPMEEMRAVMRWWCGFTREGLFAWFAALSGHVLQKDRWLTALERIREQIEVETEFLECECAAYAARRANVCSKWHLEPVGDRVMCLQTRDLKALVVHHQEN